MKTGKLAVVGSGIAGLAAAWLLARRFDVTLFEAQGRLGGHTHTLEVCVDGIRAPVDTGFLVFNDRTYPNLVALFRRLGVADAPSDMSFSVSIEDDGVEWGGSSLGALFAQKANLVRAEFWAMLRDILRLNSQAAAMIDSGRLPAGSLAELLERGGYGAAFRDWYLLPMAAAIWSCPTGQMAAYPAAPFLRFCHNHGLLRINGRPKWRTVRGGGREYVRKLVAGLQDVRLDAPVLRIQRLPGGVEVEWVGGRERFDQVVLGCHSDEALRLLADADADERSILGSVPYQSNRVVLHTDTGLMPRARETWASWNYASGEGRPGMRPVSVSYWLNSLQPLPFNTPVIETLNPIREPDAAAVLARFEYSHPIFDAPAIRAQARLPGIQGRRHTWFCGAWTAHGFHEDGLCSALAVAEALGVRAPWRSPVAAHG